MGDRAGDEADRYVDGSRNAPPVHRMSKQTSDRDERRRRKDRRGSSDRSVRRRYRIPRRLGVRELRRRHLDDYSRSVAGQVRSRASVEDTVGRANDGRRSYWRDDLSADRGPDVSCRIEPGASAASAGSGNVQDIGSDAVTGTGIDARNLTPNPFPRGKGNRTLENSGDDAVGEAGYV